MAIESNVLRTLVQTPATLDTPVDLRTGKDLPTQSHSRFSLFRSGAEKSANQAQFESLRGILAGDPTLMSAPGAARAAYAAVAKAAESGAPLTARLVAQAYSAGDAAVQGHRDAMAVARNDFLGQGMRALEKDMNSGLPSAVMPDDARLASLNSGDPKLPLATRQAVAAIILDQARADLAETGHAFDPAIADTGKLLKTAAAKSVDAIAKLLANPPTSANPAGVSPRIAPLVDELRTFSQLRMGARLFSSAGANLHHEQEIGRTMQAKLSAMSNENFLTLYKTLQSADLMEYRLALANANNPGADQLLADLQTWEGQVHEDMARRVELGRSAGPGLSGNNMAILGDAEKGASRDALNRQSDAWLSGASTQRTHAPGLTSVATTQGVSPALLQKTLHDAELTINVPFHLFASSRTGDNGFQTFMGERGAVVPEQLELQNIFDRGAGAKGADYLDRRQAIEHSQFHGLVKQDAGGLSSADHPISAAVNFGRSTGGAAAGMGYGNVVLVLKPEVRDRCTYTARDSFDTYECRIDTAGKDRFMAGLADAAAGNNKLISPTLVARLNNEPALLDSLRERLDMAEADGVRLGPSQGKNLDAFMADVLLKGLVSDFDVDDQKALLNLAIKSFVDPEATKAHVATRDHLDRMFTAMKSDTATALQSASDPLRVNGGGAYIEAQVWGGIDLTRDVAEIRIPGEEYGEGYSAFAADRDFDPEDFYAEGTDNIARLADQFGIQTKTFEPGDLNLKRLQTDTSAQPFSVVAEGAPAATRAGGLTSFKATHLPALLDKYRSHEQGFDPDGLHGRQHVSRALLYSNVLANVTREHGAVIDSHALYTTTVLHDVGRENNGVDRWERQSSEAAVAALREAGVTDETYLKQAAACVDSTAPTKAWTLERGLLKSADSLDILRLHKRENYDADLLWFMKGDVQVAPGKFMVVDPALRNALIDEVEQFVAATATPVHPNKALLATANAELSRLSELPISEQTREVRQRIDELEVQCVTLSKDMVKEMREASDRIDSAELFNGLEAELLNHPEKYPTLHKYYNPAT